MTDLPLALVAVAPVLGLLGAAMALRFIGRGAAPGTADEYLRAFHDPAHVLGVRAACARIVAAVCTLGSGAPMGMEGPSLYFGATVGAQLQRRLPKPLRHADARTLLVAGAAAGVAAIFKAPATGVVFAMEVPYRDDMARHALLPRAGGVRHRLPHVRGGGGHRTAVQRHREPVVRPADLLGAVLLGVVAGLGARFFAALVRAAKAQVQRPLWLRVLGGGSV